MTPAHMPAFDTLNALAMAFGLGLLVGMQRQRAGKALAGIRTFPLITVFGTLCALLTERLGIWLVAFGLCAFCSRSRWLPATS